MSRDQIKGPPKLRLVHDRSRPKFARSSFQDPQLLLPLAIPHNLVVIDVTKYRYKELDDALAFANPRWVWDFRRLARFDVLAGSRAHAFKLFERYEAGYADIFGMFRRGLPFKELTRISLWRRVLGVVIRKDHRFSGPVLILTDNMDEFFAISDRVVAALYRSTKQRYGISVLTEGFLTSRHSQLQEVI